MFTCVRVYIYMAYLQIIHSTVLFVKQKDAKKKQSFLNQSSNLRIIYHVYMNYPRDQSWKTYDSWEWYYYFTFIGKKQRLNKVKIPQFTKVKTDSELKFPTAQLVFLLFSPFKWGRHTQITEWGDQGKMPWR